MRRAKVLLSVLLICILNVSSVVYVYADNQNFKGEASSRENITQFGRFEVRRGGRSAFAGSDYRADKSNGTNAENSWSDGFDRGSNTTYNRRAEIYSGILNKLDVENHWLPGNKRTYCNKYAMAVMEAMGVPISDNTMSANQMCDWFKSSDGYNAGWKRVDYSEAQERANNGYPTFAMHKGLYHGHIAAVVPSETGNQKSYDEWHYVRISQAGYRNFRNATISYAWSQEDYNLNSIMFFTHD